MDNNNIFKLRQEDDLCILIYIVDELEFSLHNTTILTRLWLQYPKVWQRHAPDLLATPTIWAGLVKVDLLKEVLEHASFSDIKQRLLENNHTMALAYMGYKWQNTQEWMTYAKSLVDAYDSTIKPKCITSAYVSWTDHVIAAASILRKSCLPHASLLWASYMLDIIPEIDKDNIDIQSIEDELNCWPPLEAHVIGWFWRRRLTNNGNQHAGYPELAVLDKWSDEPPSLLVPLSLIGNIEKWNSSDLAQEVYYMMKSVNRLDTNSVALPSLY